MLYFFAFNDLDAAPAVHSWQTFYTIVRYSLFRWSICIAATLGTVRAIVILQPFARINKRVVLGVLACSGDNLHFSLPNETRYFFNIRLVNYFVPGILTTCSVVWRVLSEDPYWNIYTQQVLRFDKAALTPALWTSLSLYLLTSCICVASALASMFGLHNAHVRRAIDGLQPGAECPACKTVMLINLLVLTAALVTGITLGVTWSAPDQVVLIRYLEFLQFPLCNSAMSALNPLITVSRSGILKKMRAGKKTGVAVPNHTSVSAL